MSKAYRQADGFNDAVEFVSGKEFDVTRHDCIFFGLLRKKYAVFNAVKSLKNLFQKSFKINFLYF